MSLIYFLAKVTNTDTNTFSEIPGVLQNIDESWFSDPYATRYFSASLPKGKFKAEFINDLGDIMWPTFVEEVWGKEPECFGSASPGDVDIIEPLDFPKCTSSNLVRLGDLADQLNSTEPFIHTMHNRNAESDIKIAVGKGLGGKDALVAFDRLRHWTGLGQALDSRCSQMHVGEWFEFSARVMMMNKDETLPAAGKIVPGIYNKVWPMFNLPINCLFFHS